MSKFILACVVGTFGLSTAGCSKLEIAAPNAKQETVFSKAAVAANPQPAAKK